MPKKETNKYYYIISVIVALLVIGVTISASFAFFTNSGSTTGTATVITSGDLSLELVDGNVVGTTEGMVPGDSVTKSFIVRNTGTLDTTYDIYFSEVLNTFADKSDLVYSISSSDGGYNTLSDQVMPHQSGNESKIIDAYSINANSSQTYTLTIKFLSKNKNQDNNKGKTFSGKLQINEYKGIATLIPGEDINIKMKQLANPGQDNITSYYNDNNIKSFVRSSTLNDNIDKEIISIDNDNYPVYMWYDNGTIYYYSDAGKIYLNENSSYIFQTLNSIESIDLSSFDSSLSNSIVALFYDTKKLESVNFGNSWNTSNITSMDRVFYGTGLEEVDLSSWDTSNVKSIYNFYETSNLKKINVSNWNLSKVQSYRNSLYVLFGDKTTNIEEIIARNVTIAQDNLKYAFAYERNLKKIDISGLNMINGLTSLQKTFFSCESLEEIIGLEELDTSEVTDMSFLFGGIPFEVLDLSTFDTSKVKDMTCMFAGMLGDGNKLKTIYVDPNKWSTASVTSDSGMFSYDINLVGGAGTTFDINSYPGSQFAHIDEGPSNPGYLTDIADKPTYKYWTDNYSGTQYISTSAPTAIYPNYNNLITNEDFSVFIRTTYKNDNPNKHEVCLYYKETNRIFCLDYSYWASIIGSDHQSVENGQTVKESLRESLQNALNVTINSSDCNSSSASAVCNIGSASCNVLSSGVVSCSNGSVGCSSVIYNNGIAVCSQN